ncbi:TPA: preprotein translocase subunit SecE [Candidatus Campbellbacteria bacterium]|uniref:Protein translocase subunit SecE n=1 Tax=Candidatus Campbellbacteria bacterium RIFCSPLOWO2_01_FULL_34_15 TaxID=1797579 RepID=A0A1F5EPS9_9BACT|nr:MAG: preprotein translocase subunit SecE [Candidatus Campbellbacteria bacterium RIFCSPLOWO2_01_FULL_34_15]HAP73956.1 preprotein translocase subunit SecE [Candidatus Campbellbacteria bacterium]HAQ02023.1 preprotein translocase subunit SecE [Candidatus Campbellbacteria bacterium]HBC70651.1 preprotein translocase subunit SecE [Candidatus Campbellbacteria bacterium]
MMKLIDYLKDTRGEMKHVSWPTKSQAVWYTIIVIVISLFVAFFLGFFDYIFSLLIEKFII